MAHVRPFGEREKEANNKRTDAYLHTYTHTHTYTETHKTCDGITDRRGLGRRERESRR